MNEKERLVEELNKIMPCTCIDAYKLRKLSAPDCCHCNYIEDFIEFVIKDRQRIVDPLVKLGLKPGKVVPIDLSAMHNITTAAIETIKLAGIGDKE